MPRPWRRLAVAPMTQHFDGAEPTEDFSSGVVGWSPAHREQCVANGLGLETSHRDRREERAGNSRGGPRAPCDARRGGLPTPPDGIGGAEATGALEEVPRHHRANRAQ